MKGVFKSLIHLGLIYLPSGFYARIKKATLILLEGLKDIYLRKVAVLSSSSYTRCHTDSTTCNMEDSQASIDSLTPR